MSAAGAAARRAPVPDGAQARAEERGSSATIPMVRGDEGGHPRAPTPVKWRGGWGQVWGGGGGGECRRERGKGQEGVLAGRQKGVGGRCTSWPVSPAKEAGARAAAPGGSRAAPAATADCSRALGATGSPLADCQQLQFRGLGHRIPPLQDFGVGNIDDI